MAAAAVFCVSEYSLKAFLVERVLQHVLPYISAQKSCLYVEIPTTLCTGIT